MKDLIKKQLEEFDVIFGTDKEFVLGDSSKSRAKVFLKESIQEVIDKVVEMVEGMKIPKKGKLETDLAFIEQVTIYNQALEDLKQQLTKE